ncbi:DUF294 nucleotidyltransferase-like domain-containing protein [Halalkalibacter urbisdiaboli]|uniref:DUF294 nucleotidyltransferase-like domain-containing protein n=1 Tax=Halalkalibacter urbisdiaboli TaxID=1960589 RepID=UPI000B430B74|nr:DUF294 nucleotidyltransferase-like domain-containing protein [Halalkalibacter urbisdiaboli]
MSEIRRPSHESDDWERCYQVLKIERMQEMQGLEPSPEALHLLHESLMKKAVRLAIEKNESEWGPAPAHFAFFVMGSAGRHEQSFWSDQDHGLVFDSEDEAVQDYFLRLGEEIVLVLEKAGYEKCDGKVMASNPRWCKSLKGWYEQIDAWLENDTWENLRFALTFFDSRVLIGEHSFIHSIKERLFTTLQKEPRLLDRLADNTGRLRRGVGPFGQLLVETKGEHQGKFDLKQIALFPFVNGLRLLALKEEIYETSTHSRFELLPAKYKRVKALQTSYDQLLQKRLVWQRDVTTYDDIHYLSVKKLSTEDKKQLKKWVQEGRDLYKHIESLMGR